MAPFSNSSSISSTMLERIRARSPEAWERLVYLYNPLIYRWCRQSGVARDDAADVVQEVFIAVSTYLPSFRRKQPGDSFSAWVRAITKSKIHDHFRHRRGGFEARGGTTAQQLCMEIPDEPARSRDLDETGVDALLYHRALELVRAEFEDRTWAAFRHVVIDRRQPSDVAEDLGLSVNAVYKAKSRVLRRLREEFAELLE